MGALVLAASLLLAPPAFTPAPGWHVKRGSVSCPGVPRRLCPVVGIASTTRWRDCLNCLPHKTIAALPRTAIAIQTQVVKATSRRVDKTFRWPLRLRPADVQAGFEGVPHRYGVYEGTTRVGGRDVSVFVFFGRARPSRRQLQTANAELRRAQLA